MTSNVFGVLDAHLAMGRMGPPSLKTLGSSKGVRQRLDPPESSYSSPAGRGGESLAPADFLVASGLVYRDPV